jgi:hypothetical protein
MVREIPWHGKTLPRGLAVFDHAHTIRIRYIKKSIGQTNVKSVTSITIQIHELAIQQNHISAKSEQTISNTTAGTHNAGGRSTISRYG